MAKRAPRITVNDIVLPYGFHPRSYQLPFFKAMDAGCKRAALVWHRRAGKDLSALNYTVKEMWKRVGSYYHMLPTFKQGRKIVWDGITGNERKFTSYFPREIVRRVLDQEMKIELENGSIWQLIGTDDFDRIMGTNPVGLVLSEYSLQHPKAWELLRPILAENHGWAIFAYTPRGHNHGFQLFQNASRLDHWFAQLLTVDDTRRDALGEDGSFVVTAAQIERERQEGMEEDLIQQEFYCSWYGAMQGCYFLKEVNKAREEGRIKPLLIQPTIPVHTCWDIGIYDSTAIWFFQKNREEWAWLNYIEDHGEGIEYYLKLLQEWQREKGITFGKHYAPHDADYKDFGTGQKSIKVTARKLGFRLRIVPKGSVQQGIQAVRSIIPVSYFDEKSCAKGIVHLENYQKEYDEKLRTFKKKPKHDEHCHSADSMRTGAVGCRAGDGVDVPLVSKTDFDPYTYDKSVERGLRRIDDFNVFK